MLTTGSAAAFAVLSDAAAGPSLLFLPSPAAAMPLMDDVHLFGNDDAGNDLFDAAFSNISIHRCLRLLLD